MHYLGDAVEFEFNGENITYPTNVCIKDDISGQSVMFWCEGLIPESLHFQSWDSSSTCDGDAQHNGSSFAAYINQQPSNVQTQFGRYTIECAKKQCDYLVIDDYAFTGDCESWIKPNNAVPQSTTYFIKDYCLPIMDGNDIGSLAWGCDYDNSLAYWISYDGHTDCSDPYRGTISSMGFGGECVPGLSNTETYTEAHCYSATDRPTRAPITSDPITAEPTTAEPTTDPTVKGDTEQPSGSPTTPQPTTAKPTTATPTQYPTTAEPTAPTTAEPTTAEPTTYAPTPGVCCVYMFDFV